MTTTTPTPTAARRYTFDEAVGRLQHEAKRKVDLILTEGRDFRPELQEGTPVIEIADGLDVPLQGEQLTIQPHAHGQLAAKTGIPLRYYQRMVDEAPELWRESVATWFSREPRARLVRTLAPNGEPAAARAFLSDRFFVLDNLPFVTRLLHAVGSFDPIIESAHVDDDRFFLKLLLPNREVPIRKVGEVVRQGLTVSNSEVGVGSVQISPWFQILSCTNGMTRLREYKRRHIGSELPAGILRPETKAKMADAVWSEVEDFARAMLQAEELAAFVENVEAAADNRIDAPARALVANVANDCGLSQVEANAVLDRYLRDAHKTGDTQWGVVQAVTYVAHEGTTYARQVELEDVGGRLLEQPANAFRNAVTRRVSDREIDRAFGKSTA